MILRYTQLSHHPAVFLSLTGLRVPEFAALIADLLPGYAARERDRLQRPDRRRAIGAGHPCELRPRDQLLLAVAWLRQYPTHEVLGYLFGVSDTTVTRIIARWLPLLEAAGRDTMRLPDPGRKRRRHRDALLADTPALAVISDTCEQRVQRPRDRAAADRLYSGKKRQHTLKRQIAINAITGAIIDVADSVPGRPPTARWSSARGCWRACRPAWGRSATWPTSASPSCTPRGPRPAASRAGAPARLRTAPTTAPSPGAASPRNTPSATSAVTRPAVKRIGIIGATTPRGSGPWPGWSIAASAASLPTANGSPRDPPASGVGAVRPAQLSRMLSSCSPAGATPRDSHQFRGDREVCMCYAPVVVNELWS